MIVNDSIIEVCGLAVATALGSLLEGGRRLLKKVNQLCVDVAVIKERLHLR